MATEDPRQQLDKKQGGYPPPGGIFNREPHPLIPGGGNIADKKSGTVVDSPLNDRSKPR
jgi:hypothetical protein